jgi:hypothetical protein
VVEKGETLRSGSYVGPASFSNSMTISRRNTPHATPSKDALHAAEEDLESVGTSPRGHVRVAVPHCHRGRMFAHAGAIL